MKLQTASLLFFSTIFISACSTTQIDRSEKYQVGRSYLQKAKQDNVSPETLTGEQEESNKQDAAFVRLDILQANRQGFENNGSLADMFDDKASLLIAAEAMPIVDFIHYGFGELLGASYILGDGLADISSPITLNVQDKISRKKLFTLAEQLLAERGVTVKYQNDLFYISKSGKDSGNSTVVGYGKNIEAIPNALKVTQIVPLDYVISNSILSTMRTVASVKVTPDMSQGVLFLEGERQQIIKAIELLQLLDTPGSLSRHVALLTLTYLSAEDFIKAVTEILQNEGLMTRSKLTDNRLSFVEIPQLGAIAVFARDDKSIKRVEFWARQIDKPSSGSEQSYFIYSPKFARASDLGQSMSALLNGRSSSVSQAQDGSNQRAAAIEGNARNNTGNNVTASTDSLKMVADERSNSLIFYSTGTEYQALLPLIERLDVMPKQVLLELTIAEVTLTDEFSFGVDAAFTSGKFSFSNDFGAGDIGGAVLKWASGSKLVDIAAFESNGLVNVLSKPTLLVRDGVNASIDVGEDIPVVGSTTTDPTNGTIRSIEYRKTGITVSVTPTINAQGVVIMTVEQTTSNQVDGGAAVEGNPLIFERSLNTEVVAESGQTIVLGGLISERASDTDAGLPGIHRLPVIGALFGSTKVTKVKTELVIMITPRVISQTDEWDAIKQQIKQGLNFITIE